MDAPVTSDAPVKKSEAFAAEHARGSGSKRKVAAGSQCSGRSGRSWADQMEEDSDGPDWERADYGTPDSEEPRPKSSQPAVNPNIGRIKKDICVISNLIDEATRRHDDRKVDELVARRESKIEELALYEELPNTVTITELDPSRSAPKASQPGSSSAQVSPFEEMAKKNQTEKRGTKVKADDSWLKIKQSRQRARPAASDSGARLGGLRRSGLAIGSASTSSARS